MEKQEFKGQATKEQIEVWKNKYGEIFSYKVDDKICYLRKPDRKILSYAQSVANGNEMRFNELLLENCFIGGDEAIKKEDRYFLGINGELSELIEIKTGELVKL